MYVWEDLGTEFRVIDPAFLQQSFPFDETDIMCCTKYSDLVDMLISALTWKEMPSSPEAPPTARSPLVCSGVFITSVILFLGIKVDNMKETTNPRKKKTSNFSTLLGGQIKHKFSILENNVYIERIISI